jgi:hypothetical protein
MRIASRRGDRRGFVASRRGGGVRRDYCVQLAGTTTIEIAAPNSYCCQPWQPLTKIPEYQKTTRPMRIASRRGREDRRGFVASRRGRGVRRDYCVQLAGTTAIEIAAPNSYCCQPWQPLTKIPEYQKTTRPMRIASRRGDRRGFVASRRGRGVRRDYCVQLAGTTAIEIAAPNSYCCQPWQPLTKIPEYQKTTRPMRIASRRGDRRGFVASRRGRGVRRDYCVQLAGTTAIEIAAPNSYCCQPWQPLTKIPEYQKTTRPMRIASRRGREDRRGLL